MRALAALLVLAAPAAFAGDGGIAEEVNAALARGDRAAAVKVLKALVLPDAPRDRRRSVEGAHAAMELVGGSEGDILAARILLDTLKADVSDREGAYSLAMGLRRRVRDVDLAAARELYAGLVRIYPEAIDFEYDLAKAYLHSGLSDQALAEYGRIAALVPSAQDVRFQLALLHEYRGELDEAAAVYDELIAMGAGGPRPNLDAHLYKGWLLLRRKQDCAAARKALAAGLAAADASDRRDAYLPQFEELRADLEDEEQRRRSLHEMRDHLDASLWMASAAWVIALGGGVACLRRAKWL